MSRQIDHGPARADRLPKKWSILRSRAVPASVALSELQASSTPRPDESKPLKKTEPLPAALHKSPGYFETANPLLLKK